MGLITFAVEIVKTHDVATVCKQHVTIILRSGDETISFSGLGTRQFQLLELYSTIGEHEFCADVVGLCMLRACVCVL